MLDAYIIDRIRREREAEQQRGAVIPLHIETPEPRPEVRKERPVEDEDHGSTVIDYKL